MSSSSIVTLIPFSEHELTIYEVGTNSETQSADDYVHVKETNIGKGVFTMRPYPICAIIGEITGTRVSDPNYGSEYAFEIDDQSQLEPDSPFRFINHSCDPNCEFDFLDESGESDPSQSRLYLIALRDIRPGEQLTIDYNWPASHAIQCRCNTNYCRGWVVAKEELHLIDCTKDQPVESPSNGN